MQPAATPRLIVQCRNGRIDVNDLPVEQLRGGLEPASLAVLGHRTADMLDDSVVVSGESFWSAVPHDPPPASVGMTSVHSC